MKTINSIKSLIAATLLPLAVYAGDNTLAQTGITGDVNAKVANRDILGRGFVTSDDPYLETGASINMPSAKIDGHDVSGYGYVWNRNNIAKQGKERGTYIATGANIDLPYSILNLEAGQLSTASGAIMPELDVILTAKAPLNPKFEAIIGGKDWPGKYFSIGAGKSFAIDRTTSANISAKLGYNDHYGAVPYSAFSHANLDISLTKNLANIALTAGARLQHGLGGHARDAQQVYLKTAYKY